jgi:hypothetical protein
MEMIWRTLRFLALDRRVTRQEYRLYPSISALSYRLQLPMPGRTRKTKEKIRIPRSKGHRTRYQKGEPVTEGMESDCCLLPRMIYHLEVEKACLQRTVQADIDGAVNATPGNPIDVIIAVSVSGVHSRVSPASQGE